MLYPLPAVRQKVVRPNDFLTNVDNILDRLWPEKDFRKYLDAVTNKSAVEGKFEVTALWLRCKSAIRQKTPNCWMSPLRRWRKSCVQSRRFCAA